MHHFGPIFAPASLLPPSLVELRDILNILMRCWGSWIVAAEREGAEGAAESILAREASSARQSAHRTNILEMNCPPRIRRKRRVERRRTIFLAPIVEKVAGKKLSSGKFERGSLQLVALPPSLPKSRFPRRRLTKRTSESPFLPLFLFGKRDLRTDWEIAWHYCIHPTTSSSATGLGGIKGDLLSLLLPCWIVRGR